MNEIIQINNNIIQNQVKFSNKKIDFISIHNKSYKLAAAVFVISNLMDENEELRTKIKKLALEIVSMSVGLKDINFSDVRKLILDMEKCSLELMSMIDIASIAGLISKMNGTILKEEFQSFILELSNFSVRSENTKNISIDGVFGQSLSNDDHSKKTVSNFSYKNDADADEVVDVKNGNGYKRKNLRKNNILAFIKGHNNVNIKDITPNIVGCSEKTIQRELIQLIKEEKIIKTGERRWSRYSAV